MLIYQRVTWRDTDRWIWHDLALKKALKHVEEVLIWADGDEEDDDDDHHHDLNFGLSFSTSWNISGEFSRFSPMNSLG